MSARDGPFTTAGFARMVGKAGLLGEISLKVDAATLVAMHWRDMIGGLSKFIWDTTRACGTAGKFLE
jgi:hypothetical protein